MTEKMVVDKSKFIFCQKRRAKCERFVEIYIVQSGSNPNCVYQFSVNGWSSLMHNFRRTVISANT